MDAKIQERKMVKAHAIISSGKMPEMVNENTYKVPSQRGSWVYTVTNDNDSWACDCPDYNKRGANCKHIYAVKIWLELKDSMKEPEYKPLSYHDCPYCGSYEVVKNGSRKTKNGRKTRFLCRDCNRTFSLKEEGFENMKFDSKVITEALSLYFSGVSYRMVAQHLRQKGIKIDHTTVYYWVKHYTKVISEYVDTLKPELGDMWNVDEMAVKVKEGGLSRQRGVDTKWVWLWNMMDTETRFLISNMVSKKKRIRDAKRIFQDAKDKAGVKPKFITSDGLAVYHNAFNKVFYDHHRSCTHISEVGIRDRINNNRVERLHGTVRQREKVMRAMENPDTSADALNGFRVYYNFVRPHMALDGKTPAEMAGIDLDLGADKWMGLIQKASTSISTPRGQLSLNGFNQP